MAPIRVALIGLSQAAKTNWASEGHLPYLLSSRGKERYVIKALLNSSIEAAKRAIEYYRLPSATKAYSSPEKLAGDPDIDLVVCTTRVDIHYDTVKPSIEAGKALFVEWPLAENVTRAKELADLAKKSGSPTLVGLQAQVAPAILKVKELLESGGLGKVLSSRAEAYSTYAERGRVSEGLGYFLDKKVGGNPIVIAFGHMIDFVHSVLGEFESSNDLVQIQRPDQVIYNKETGSTRPYTSDVPDLLSLHGTLASSTIVQTGASLLVHYRTGPTFPGTKPFTWTINCEKGEIRISSAKTSSLQAEGSAHPIPIEVHDFATDSVKDIDWGWEDWQAPLFPRSKNIAKLYDLYAEGKLDAIPTFGMRSGGMSRLMGCCGDTWRRSVSIPRLPRKSCQG